MMCTLFLDEHPGGRDYILDNSGGDASRVFSSEEIHGHSETARSMLRQYHIGTVEGHRPEPSKPHDIKGKAPQKELVDLSKAAIPQILKLGGEYQDWVHHTAGPKGFRIFESAFFESFSHYPWWYIFFMWIPAISITFALSLKNGCPWWVALLMFPVGMFVWSLLEYFLHRFIFHMTSSTGIGNVLHFLIHGIHHLTPTDPTRLAFPPVFGAVLGYTIYSGIVQTFGLGAPQAIFSGGAFTYLMYDTMHYYFHHGDLPWLPDYFRWMKSRHLDHHFKSENKNFGVTSPLWDIVFGTA
jgi:sterol desaturase/sphingolipid hydroxylase (fatty acid hydroxylase superfamily)